MLATSSLQRILVMISKIHPILGDIDFKNFHFPNEIYWMKHELCGIQDIIYFVRIYSMLRILQTILWYIKVPIEGPDLKMLIFPAYHLSSIKWTLRIFWTLCWKCSQCTLKSGNKIVFRCPNGSCALTLPKWGNWLLGACTI